MVYRDSHRAHDRLVRQLPETLATVLGISPGEIKAVPAAKAPSADAIFTALQRTFVVEFRQTTSAASIAFAAKQVREWSSRMRGPVVPLVAVPFMGEVGKQACADAGVSWLDLSGNAHIVAGTLRIHFEGRPNRFRSAGRPADVFAAKSARVVRWLLMHPDQFLSQREIARSTSMNEGFVSRIVARLERENYVVRGEQSGVRPRDPGLLLEAWRERYDFSKHHIIRGHVAARSGDALLRSIAEALDEEKAEYAATGLAAAWVFSGFAAFQLTTIYVADDPAAALLHRLAFREEPRGANLWFVVPKDAGVFQGGVVEKGVRCVHPVQAYLDLKSQPERAAEAADRLQAERLTWTRNA
jgi:hypothetical protein